MLVPISEELNTTILTLAEYKTQPEEFLCPLTAPGSMQAWEQEIPEFKWGFSGMY